MCSINLHVFLFYFFVLLLFCVCFFLSFLLLLFFFFFFFFGGGRVVDCNTCRYTDEVSKIYLNFLLYSIGVFQFF